MRIETDTIRITPTFFKVYLPALLLLPTGIAFYRHYEWTSDAIIIQGGTNTAKRNYNYWYKEPESKRATNEPGIDAKSDTWQMVVKWKFYVYSAYYDDRRNESKMVVVVAAIKEFRTEVARCTFWYETPKSSYVLADIKCWERSNTNYSTCLVRCPLLTEEIPKSVAISSGDHSNLKNRLLVKDTKASATDTIGVCVTPLRHIYNDSLQLVEFIELNSILGMGHVTVYKSSVSTTTDCILRSYSEEGRATVLLWNDFFRVRSIADGSAMDITAAMNDCLYRNMYNSSHLAFLRVDEFIIPTKSDTIQQMLKTLDEERLRLRSGYEIGSFNFRYGHFPVKKPQISADIPKDVQGSLTSLKTWNRYELFPHGNRSKYIVKPTKVLELGSHKVRKFFQGYNRLTVTKSHGILSRYEKCGSVYNCNVPPQKDTRAARYESRLVAAVDTRWQLLQKKCGLNDIHKTLMDMILYPPRYKYS